MKIIHISDPVPLMDVPIECPVHVFTQFFLHRDAVRRQEIQACLQRNYDNPCITHIHLLNEKIYTTEELGVQEGRKSSCMHDLNSGTSEARAGVLGVQGSDSTKKIIQTNLGRRLKFRDVFQYVREHNLQGYIVLTNADIFFNETLSNLYQSPLAVNKSVLVQLRYEYRGQTDLSQCPIFGPRFDSQDTWCFHTNFFVSSYQERAFDFEFGQPGCDNKLLYLLLVLGYRIYNHPAFLATFHNHCQVARDYSNKNVISLPWAAICPYGYSPWHLPPSLGINMQQIKQQNQALWFSDNRVLHDYIQQRLLEHRPFLVPRIAGIENNVAVFAATVSSPNHPLYSAIQRLVPAMKNNAGIYIPSWSSIVEYSQRYLGAFTNCDLYFGWDVQGNYLGHIAQSHESLKQHLRNQSGGSKRMIWSLCLDIFHYIYNQPWTWALKGKRILVVSAFEESILEKIPKRHLLWGDSGIDLFPDCTFVTIKPPMTQADEPSLVFTEELAAFYTRLDGLRDTYDVALVSAGGYGNIICNYIYTQHGKSSVYVGGVLQMYFGILGGRWLKERPDVLRLFLNEHWSRPKINERPQGCDKVEGSCYW